MNQLDLCGTSGAGVFYLSLKKSLDVLLSLQHTDAERLAVTGQSGGGWQTILISSLDTRVKLAVPVAGYGSFMTKVQLPAYDLGDPEQQPSDLGTLADYTHQTELLAPRPTLLINNSKEGCCFRADYSLPVLLAAARPIFALLGHPNELHYHINYDPGTHNYDRDNGALYRMLGQYFFAGDKSYLWREIPSRDEVKTAQELRVALPENNKDLNKPALELSRKLPRDPELPADRLAAVNWQRSSREKLRQIVRLQEYRVGERPVLGLGQTTGLRFTISFE